MEGNADRVHVLILHVRVSNGEGRNRLPICQQV